jgi:hypothetical protein
MKEITIVAYESWDGEVFKTRAACEAHEAKSIHKRIVGLTEEQCINAINRDDCELAEVLEKVGLMIRAARRKAGDLKRPPRAQSPPKLASATPVNGATEGAAL